MQASKAGTQMRQWAPAIPRNETPRCLRLPTREKGNLVGSDEKNPAERNRDTLAPEFSSTSRLDRAIQGGASKASMETLLVHGGAAISGYLKY
jgi:hypothetical protein